MVVFKCLTSGSYTGGTRYDFRSRKRNIRENLAIAIGL